MKKHRKPAVCAVCAAAGVLVAVFAIRGGKPSAASIEAADGFPPRIANTATSTPAAAHTAHTAGFLCFFILHPPFLFM